MTTFKGTAKKTKNKFSLDCTKLCNVKFFNYLSLIFDSVFRFRFRFRDSVSVSGFRIPCFSAAARSTRGQENEAWVLYIHLGCPGLTFLGTDIPQHLPILR